MLQLAYYCLLFAEFFPNSVSTHHVMFTIFAFREVRRRELIPVDLSAVPVQRLSFRAL